MRGFALLGLLIACSGSDELRVDPPLIDTTVELDTAARIPLVVTAGGADITEDATFTLDGKPLGTVDATGFLSDGRTGGVATIVVAHGDARVEVPVHVALHSTRITGGPADPATLFAAAADTVALADIDPAEGAVVPPNLGRLDVSFASAVDLHEVAVAAPDLDLRIYGTAAAGPRTVALTAAEWDAVVRTRRGQRAEVRVRSLASTEPSHAELIRSHIAVADVPFATQILFTGKTATESPRMWSYDPVRTETTLWSAGPAGTACFGCHLAISRDGTRIAAGGGDGTNGGGLLVDAATRGFAVPPNAAIGNWTGAAFAPDNTMVTTNVGAIAIRDAATAVVRTTITPELPANQPAVSHAGTLLAYAAGAIDPVSTQPATTEIRIHTFDGAASTLGAPRTLVAATPSQFVKLPDFSSDDGWVLYTRVPALFRANGTVSVVRADGSAAPIDLASDIGLARFATPIVPGYSGGPDDAPAEPMTWIVMRSDRAVGGRLQSAVGQLWAMAFYPARGVASRPFCLPGQAADIAVLHAPIALPQP